MSVLHVKYVIIQTFEKQVIILPLTLNHADIQTKYPIIGAGFAFIETEIPAVEVYGRSSSLKINSSPDDAEIIKCALFHNHPRTHTPTQNP